MYLCKVRRKVRICVGGSTFEDKTTMKAHCHLIHDAERRGGGGSSHKVDI